MRSAAGLSNHLVRGVGTSYPHILEDGRRKEHRLLQTPESPSPSIRCAFGSHVAESQLWLDCKYVWSGMGPTRERWQANVRSHINCDIMTDLRKLQDDTQEHTLLSTTHHLYSQMLKSWRQGFTCETTAICLRSHSRSMLLMSSPSSKMDPACGS